MNSEFHLHDRPGLLVSVRNPAEALAALAGGADVIDVKEPERGPLGAADVSTIAAVVLAVEGRAPVTAAMGELTDLIGAKREPMPAGVALFKIGLSGCRSLPNWRTHWRDAMAALAEPLTASRRACPGGINPPAREPLVHSACPRPVAVAYADWRAAAAPEPDEVLNAAVEAGCPALLVDTWNKSAGSLFDHWPPQEVGRFLQSARKRGLLVVLAGSLAHENFMVAARLAPDLVGVRTAGCDGGRHGNVSASRIRALKQSLQLVQTSRICVGD
jgi:uncharacterized protein (UPF0264 family)